MPEELTEEELTAAMNQLNIENQPLTEEDKAAIEAAGPDEENYDEDPADQSDYLAELERLAELRDKGIISADDFEAKKKQLWGL